MPDRVANFTDVRTNLLWFSSFGKYNGIACVPICDIRPTYCIITFPAAIRSEVMCLQLISQGLETAMPKLATKWQSTDRVSLKSSSTETKSRNQQKSSMADQQGSSPAEAGKSIPILLYEPDVYVYRDWAPSNSSTSLPAINWACQKYCKMLPPQVFVGTRCIVDTGKVYTPVMKPISGTGFSAFSAFSRWRLLGLKCKHGHIGRVRSRAETVPCQCIMPITWCSWQRTDLSWHKAPTSFFAFSTDGIEPRKNS